MSHTWESNQGGLILEWRSHFLTDVAKELGLVECYEEPLLHSADAFPQWRLKTQTLLNGLCWQPKGEHVEVVPYIGQLRCLPIAQSALGSNQLLWHSIRPCTAIELTPYNQGKAGITTRIARPKDVRYGAIEWPRPGSQVIRITSLLNAAPVYIKHFVLNGTRLREFTAQPFKNNEGCLSLRGQAGVLVVVQEAAGNWVMLDWRDYDGRHFTDTTKAEHISQIEQTLAPCRPPLPSAKLENWIATWPQTSVNRLLDLYQKACSILSLDKTVAGETLCQYPTGFCRTLLLVQCQFFPTWKYEYCAELNNGTLESVMQRYRPKVFEYFKKVQSGADRLWVLRQPETLELEQLVEWAGQFGAPVMQRAFPVLGLRKQADQLYDRLRPESHEGKEVQALIQEIEKVLEQEVHLDQLQSQFQELSRKVNRQKTQPIVPDAEPPALKNLFETYQAQHQAMVTWRKHLVSLLRYCETGEWHQPQQSEATEWFLNKLNHFPSIQTYQEWVTLTDDISKTADELRICCRWLLENKEDEPNESLRTQAGAVIETQIVLQLPQWVTLHEEIRRARLVVESFPALAERAAWSQSVADVEKRSHSAQAILCILHALGLHLDRRNYRIFLEPTVNLELLLLTPEALILQTYHQYCVGYKTFFLDSNPPEPACLNVPDRLPLFPFSLELSVWNTYWEEVWRMFETKAQLEKSYRRFCEIFDALKTPFFSHLRQLIALCERLPPDDRPPYYLELKHHAEPCFQEPYPLQAKSLEKLNDYIEMQELDWPKELLRIQNLFQKLEKIKEIVYE